MIGQVYTKNFIQGLVARDYLPRFVLIVGDKGSGKKMLASYISSIVHCQSYIVPDVKIATIREIINDAYYQKNEILYIIPDIDTMSKEAQNSILKITEEPPNKAYFVMTVDDLNTVLPTIRSRAFNMWMDKYTASEICEYATSIDSNLLTDVPDIASICETPGEVNIFKECGGAKFVKFVDKVVDNVDNVSTANALKILENIDLKNEGKGYDAELFLKIFIRNCMTRASTIFDYRESQHYINMIQVSGEALRKLHVRGANKNMIMSNWIFDVRN